MNINTAGHFEDMLNERNIRIQWVQQAIEYPDKTEEHPDGTKHYLKQVPEFDNRWLRVVINVTAIPEKGVTAFFDRRLRRQNENKSR
jgi:hypothetical protein